MARNTEDRLIEFQAAVTLSKIKASVGYLSPEDLDVLLRFVGMVRRSTRGMRTDSRESKQIAVQLKANHDQVTELFSSNPNLIEETERFFPQAVAYAKRQPLA